MKNNVVMNRRNNPDRKIKSAIFSRDAFLFPRIERNENKQDAMNRMMAMVVISSMIVVWEIFITFKEVSRIKQIPSKLEDALSICGDLSLFSFIIFSVKYSFRNI